MLYVKKTLKSEVEKVENIREFAKLLVRNYYEMNYSFPEVRVCSI